MQKFIVVYKETEVVGYDNLSELKEGLIDYNQQERREKADMYDMNIDDMDSDELEELDDIWGDEAKVYETADVVTALNNSTLDADDKKSLLKELNKDQIKFKVDGIFDEVIEEVDEYFL